MDKYLEYINKLGLFLRIINLESLIQYYRKVCLNNVNEECYSNLKNSLDNCLVNYQLLLDESRYRTRDELKKSILSEWHDIAKILLKNNFSNIRNKDGKLIYGMILEIVKEDLDFGLIYLFLIEHNLYDPNVACWTSAEPFYTILPTNDFPSFRKANKKVILDKRTDFHILRNGDDIFEYASYYYRSSGNEEEKKYWREFFLWALSGNLSVLDSKRFKDVYRKWCWDYKPLVYQIFEKGIFSYLVDYLCTDEGIYRQCCNALYPTDEQAKALDFYIKELENRGITSPHLLELKKYSS